MSPAEGSGGEAEEQARRFRFRIAFFLTALVTRERPAEAHRNHTKLHMALVAIDETELLASILRPLHDLALNTGALVLGVWGIRSILTPANLYYMTAVDLALSIVIIFTLGAITVRALVYVHDEAGLGVLPRRGR